MFEKVNPWHPDKVADRISGAIVDLAYKLDDNPKVAVEVLLGHGDCNIITESSVDFKFDDIENIVHRIAGNNIKLNLKCVKQDVHLADNQKNEIRCGDNGIFKGVPLTKEEKLLSSIVNSLANEYPSDGKFIIDDETETFIACQSNASKDEIKKSLELLGIKNAVINPLGDWTGGSDVDTGCTNRKLGSDMGNSATGGGLNGKDGKTKADVCCNIWAFNKAQETGKVVQLFCAIGDTYVKGKIGDERVNIPFKEISDFGHKYIMDLGGYEKFSAWGLI